MSMSHKITPEAITRFSWWFQSKVRNGCPFCDSRDWTIHDEMAITSTVEAETHHIEPHHGAPVMQVTCNVCAFTASFSATRIGILEPDEAPDSAVGGGA